MLSDQSAVYYPEELSLLGQILDQAVQSLPLSMRTPQNRAAIAKKFHRDRRKATCVEDAIVGPELHSAEG
jgi:hypothetical protein